jgi:hypothetical protein
LQSPREGWATTTRSLPPHRTPDELIEGEESDTVRRRLEDGMPFRAVKVPHTAAGLEERLTELGWEIQVRQTAGPFFWGAGGRASRT